MTDNPKQPARAPDATYLDIVFDGPESEEFSRVENPSGQSVRYGEWIDRGDGTWALRIPGAWVGHGEDSSKDPKCLDLLARVAAAVTREELFYVADDDAEAATKLISDGILVTQALSLPNAWRVQLSEPTAAGTAVAALLLLKGGAMKQPTPPPEDGVGDDPQASVTTVHVALLHEVVGTLASSTGADVVMPEVRGVFSTEALANAYVRANIRDKGSWEIAPYALDGDPDQDPTYDAQSMAEALGEDAE